jgi:phenylpropionate dioxygenase-like ring-hydroxylating dioxygenase large terminal subunit
VDENQLAETGISEGRWPRYDAAALGFPEYWYPVLEAGKLGKKPRSVTICGEKIVLVRNQGRVYALSDRCPHRGVPLSAGRCEFPGTLTCVFHGWTYDLASGELVAALTDGPDSPICRDGSVRVATFPVAERCGLIWLYPGHGPPPPVEEDIPEELLLPDAVVAPTVELRKGNWRYAMETAVDEAHARYLHRRTPFGLFRKFPAYQTDVRMVPMADGKWLHRQSKPVFGPADYGRIGAWPKAEGFWRRAGNQIIVGRARLPAIFAVGHKDWQDFQIFVPVDADHQLTVQVAVKHARGLAALIWRLRIHSYLHLFHRIMLQRWEDGFIVNAMDSPPEHLFRPDVSITAWRRWCHDNARRPPAGDEKRIE